MSATIIVGSLYVFYVALMIAISHAAGTSLSKKLPRAGEIAFSITTSLQIAASVWLVFAGSLFFILPIIANSTLFTIALMVWGRIDAELRRTLPAALLVSLVPDIGFFVALWATT